MPDILEAPGDIADILDDVFGIPKPEFGVEENAPAPLGTPCAPAILP